MNNSENSIPAVLKRLRGAKSQAELARLCGIPQSNYTRYEAGTVKPKHDALCKIAMHFGLTVDEMLANSEPKRGEKPDAQSAPDDFLKLREQLARASARIDELERECKLICEMNIFTKAEIDRLHKQLELALDRIPKAH